MVPIHQSNHSEYDREAGTSTLNSRLPTNGALRVMQTAQIVALLVIERDRLPRAIELCGG